MDTILVPVDFSPASNNAAAYAAQISGLLHARLILLHAYMLPTPVSEVPYVMITADELQKENEALIRKQAAELEAQYQATISTIVRIGIASDEVKVICQDQQIDMVVMGMKGAGGLEKIIGSTTTNVLHKIKTPVLIVPHDAGYEPVRFICFATDYDSGTSQELFTPLVEMARAYEANLQVIHVRLNHSAAGDELTQARQKLETAFAGLPHSFYWIEDESVTKGVSNFLTKNGSQMLVMVAHKHGFFERIFSRNHTEAMAYETHVPMLVLQNKD